MSEDLLTTKYSESGPIAQKSLKGKNQKEMQFSKELWIIIYIDQLHEKDIHVCKSLLFFLDKDIDVDNERTFRFTYATAKWYETSYAMLRNLLLNISIHNGDSTKTRKSVWHISDIYQRIFVYTDGRPWYIYIYILNHMLPLLWQQAC